MRHDALTAHLSWMQVDPTIYRLYCAAFCGLYYSCKKNNKVGVWASAPVLQGRNEDLA